VKITKSDIPVRRATTSIQDIPLGYAFTGELWDGKYCHMGTFVRIAGYKVWSLSFNRMHLCSRDTLVKRCQVFEIEILLTPVKERA